jgi:hypothetical protein
MASSTRAWIVTDFGCLGGALMIGMSCSQSSLGICLTARLTKPWNSLDSLRPKRELRFQQKEAGVTPEARRDRAAILRRDGVPPLIVFWPRSVSVPGLAHLLVLSSG